VYRPTKTLRELIGNEILQEKIKKERKNNNTYRTTVTDATNCKHLRVLRHIVQRSVKYGRNCMQLNAKWMQQRGAF